jgi:hypothetical protein
MGDLVNKVLQRGWHGLSKKEQDDFTQQNLHLVAGFNAPTKQMRQARILADAVARQGRLNIPQTDVLLKLARDTTKIPSKIKNILSDEQIIAEVLGTLQRRR